MRSISMRRWSGTYNILILYLKVSNGCDLPTTLDSAISVTFSSDSRMLVGQCCDKTRMDFAVKLWDVASGQVIGTWPNAAHASFSPDSRWLAVAIPYR